MIRLSSIAAFAGAVACLTPAHAGPGDILWHIQRDGYGNNARPTVGPGGALYWTFRGLYRLNPADGEVVWFREDHASPLITIAADGTIYGTGSVNIGTPQEPFWHPTALALTPDNQVLWSWQYNANYWYPVAGPTLGPDGNIYIISYGGYNMPGHLFSLTRGGQWRWEHLWFANGSGVQHLTFANGQVMKVGSRTAVPGGPLIGNGSGLVAANMQSGALDWYAPFPDGGDPVVSPVNPGHFYVRPGLSQSLQEFTGPNQLGWSHTVQWSPTGLNTAQVGSDGNIYISEGIFRVHSLDPAGNVRWSNNSALPQSYYYWPTVSPDGSVVIYTTTGPGYDTLGYVTALRTSDGQKLWEITLPGASNGYTPVRAHGGVEFSPDSSTAYIPATSICYCGPTGYQERGHLIAVEVTSGAGACYPNCDGSTASPVLNVADFSCFLSKFAAGNSYANCDSSTTAPTLNVADFSCFLSEFASGCP